MIPAPPLTLPQLVANIKQTLRDVPPPSEGAKLPVKTVSRMLECMLAYNPTDSHDWKPFVAYGDKTYTRTLVGEGGGTSGEESETPAFNLLVLCWGPNQKSPIHDHPHSSCIMKVLEGELQEDVYETPHALTNDCAFAVAGQPTPKYTKILRRGFQTMITDKIGLHRVGNQSPDVGAVSLHLYWPPIRLCHAFDEFNGAVTNCILKPDRVVNVNESQLLKF